MSQRNVKADFGRADCSSHAALDNTVLPHDRSSRRGPAAGSGDARTSGARVGPSRVDRRHIEGPLLLDRRTSMQAGLGSRWGELRPAFLLSDFQGGDHMLATSVIDGELRADIEQLQRRDLVFVQGRIAVMVEAAKPDRVNFVLPDETSTERADLGMAVFDINGRVCFQPNAKQHPWITEGELPRHMANAAEAFLLTGGTRR